MTPINQGSIQASEKLQTALRFQKILEACEYADKEDSQMEPERQAPMTVWCGGTNADQDVSIRLVPNGINQQQQQVTDLRIREPLAVLKVHSNRLEKHSKYFQACSSTRWTHPDAPPSMEFNLELIHGLQVASYTDCFSRMYTPLRKNFKDVKSSLELLRVASRIEFLELVNSICRYLSTIPWSEEDELRIRQFSSYSHYPCSHADDLVARLRIGQHGNEDYRKKLLSRQIAHSIRIALCPPIISLERERSLSAQSLFEDLFSSIGQSKIDSAFENDVVKIVSKEVKEMLDSFHADCRRQCTEFHNLLPGKKWADIDVESVSGFKGKLMALCWALELLLKAQVAEEVIECLVHLELLFAMIHAAHDVEIDYIRPVSGSVTVRFTKLVVFIFREVVGGRLLLRIQDRGLIFEGLKYLYRFYHEPSTQNEEDEDALLEAGRHAG